MCKLLNYVKIFSTVYGTCTKRNNYHIKVITKGYPQLNELRILKLEKSNKCHDFSDLKLNDLIKLYQTFFMKIIHSGI